MLYLRGHSLKDICQKLIVSQMGHNFGLRNSILSILKSAQLKILMVTDVFTVYFLISKTWIDVNLKRSLLQLWAKWYSFLHILYQNMKKIIGCLYPKSKTWHILDIGHDHPITVCKNVFNLNSTCLFYQNHVRWQEYKVFNNDYCHFYEKYTIFGAYSR